MKQQRAVRSCGEVCSAVTGWDALSFNIFINDLEEGISSTLIINSVVLNWDLWFAPKEGTLRGPGRKYNQLGEGQRHLGKAYGTH